MVSIWLFVLLLAILYDHMIMQVGLFGHSAVVFHVFKMFLCSTDCLHGRVFFQWHFTDLFSCIAASLFNKLTYLLIPLTWSFLQLPTDYWRKEHCGKYIGHPILVPSNSINALKTQMQMTSVAN